MPLAQAAPRIGCERSPSLARSHQRPTRFGPRYKTRGPASINDRDRSFRAQAKVVRDGPPDGSGSDADITHDSGTYSPLASRADYPSAENRRPSETISGELGNLPSFVPGNGDSDLTSCGRPGGIVPLDPWGIWPGSAEPPPTRFRSRRLFRSARPIRSGRVRARSNRRRRCSHSVLCPIMRQPRVRALPSPDLVERESRSVPLVSDRLTGDIL